MPNKNLKKYEEKRQFDQTPEPKGGRSNAAALKFVIQKHDASRLHYDFRLEMEGVLKSWAVPKGPAMDPAVKRLAMQVEDHPYDYKDFEGVIPKGNYGAGTVIVWDKGTYEPLDDSVKKGKKAMEKSLLAGLKSGDLKFRLYGEKLQGSFALVKTHGGNMAENAWLLIKHKDETVSKKDVSRLDKSVISGKTIAQMQKAPDRTYDKNGSKAVASTAEPQIKARKNASKAGVSPVKKPTSKRLTKTGSKTASKSAHKTERKTERKTDTKSAEKAVNKNKKQAASERKKAASEKTAPAKTKIKNTQEKSEANGRLKTQVQALAKLPLSPMPDQVAPMLATLVDAAFDDGDWNFEIKWDGYRAIAYVKVTGKSRKKTVVAIKSRNQKPFEEKYYPIKAALEKFDESMVLDGELVVVDNKGMPQFGTLQNWRSEADGTLLYYVFDLLWYAGKDLRSLTVLDRQAVLEEIIGQTGQPGIRMGYSVQGTGKSFLASAAKLGLEGMVAKRRDSVYETGRRSKNWLKIKVELRQEVIIIGYTLNKGSSKKFSSLLLGVYKGKVLHYVGKVGTGFTDQDQAALLKAFKPLERKTSPLAAIPQIDKPSRFRPDPPGSEVTWLRPSLVGEVSYRERTADGLFRHPSFKGLRSDKDPKEVILEQQNDTGQVLKQKNETMDSKGKGSRSAKSAESKAAKPTEVKTAADTKTKNQLQKALRPAQGASIGKTLLNPTEKTQVKKVGGRSLEFTNLDKLYWKKEKIAKRDLINYYNQMAPFILPYLKDRPQSLNRFPDGITGQNFYQKDVTGKVPDWASLYLYHSEGDKKDKHFLVADNIASLLYMASLGCIEMNPWSSTVNKPEHPTWCIIDLDPDKKKKGQKAFDEVITAALATRDVLSDLKVKGYPKTSGSTGMHIYIPLGNKYSYEQSKIFAKMIVSMVHEALPGFTTLERSVADRQGKMYLDFLQNRPQATIAAPYSVRPKPGATVSMPLDWAEVKPGLKKEDFTIENAFARVQETGDLFKPVLGKGIDLKKILKQMQ